MFKFEKLAFGDSGWGDEFLIATLMTLLVSIMSMGLGLSIASKIINDHNGIINFKSMDDGAKIEIIFNLDGNRNINS